MSSKITVQLSEEKLATVQAFLIKRNSHVTRPASVPTVLIPTSTSLLECPDSLCRACILTENSSLGGTIKLKIASRKNSLCRKKNTFGQRFAIEEPRLTKDSLTENPVPYKWISDKGDSYGRAMQ